MSSRLDNEFAFMGTALNLRAYRQEVLASNIANADTPHYKAQDFDFATELRRVQAGGEGRLGLSVTRSGHLAGRAGNPYGVDLQYRTDVQPSIDGNTVNMDVERAQFADNALHYQFVADRVAGKVRELLLAIKGQ